MRILRGLTSRVLPCGCIAGVYETYDGHVVTMIDERQPMCDAPNHAEGNEIPKLSDGAPSTGTAPSSPRRR